MRCEWDVLPQDVARATSLATCCGVSLGVAQVLLNRGIAEPKAAQRFLEPSFEQLSNPLALPDMAPALSRIRAAVASNEPILIFGDADVDGITASAILYEALTELGARVVVRLSNRIADGYGLPTTLIKRFARLGIKLLMLVDCGTNQPDEIRALASCGIDTIVLDHHVPADHRGRPLALINPRCGPDSNLPTLASAGLALKLVQALSPHDEEAVLRTLDLAALGTLADYAPLLGDNRTIVVLGLKRLMTTHRVGLRRLCDAVGLTRPTVDQVLRRLVPCLNAAGRLGNPRPVWELLVEPSAQRVERLLGTTQQAHSDTKLLHRQMLAEVNEQANRVHFKYERVLVLGRRGWHPGFMGPVAAQLVDRYARPAIAIAFSGTLGVGSGRSLETFDLLNALRVCDGMLLRYGGHPQACGLTIHEGNLERFRERINQHAHDLSAHQRCARRLQIDLELSLQQVTSALARDLERLQPFGPGNPKPLALIRGVTTSASSRAGAWIEDDTARLRARGLDGGLLPGERYDVVGGLGLVKDEPLLSVCDVRVVVLGDERAVVYT